jgi:ABC-type lipoprotein export system ATPase subunit
MSTTTEAVPAIELANVTVTFSRRDDDPLTVVDNLGLKVAPGTIHCLAGRSGSGKTTVLRVAVATLRPNSGTIAWAGARVDDLSPDRLAAARRKHLGYVDQGATAIGELTVLDNVLLPAVPTGITPALEQRARDLITQFGLGTRGRQRARTLSGGERQRLAIARALLLEPTLLAVDEPTASLDRASATTVLAALSDAAASGSAVLVASHDPAVLEAASATTHLD